MELSETQSNIIQGLIRDSLYNLVNRITEVSDQSDNEAMLEIEAYVMDSILS